MSQDARARILALVEKHPGIHAARLAVLMGLSWNGTAHHLRRMRVEGRVATIRVGNRRLYFLPADEPLARAAACLTSEAARAIARHIRASPGATVRELAASTSLSRRVVYHHAKRLRDVGALAADGEPLRFCATPLLLRLMRVA